MSELEPAQECAECKRLRAECESLKKESQSLRNVASQWGSEADKATRRVRQLEARLGRWMSAAGRLFEELEPRDQER